ncbi:hypothetical protein TNCV_677541 [Trichonephila clavipes]|nr:hypothetical protein TNCV_677541 [Trichonephila clavipes]
MIEEVVDLVMEMEPKEDSGEVQELLDSHNQALTVDKLIEMYEKEQNIELESVDSVQSENRMTVGILRGFSF